MLLLEIHLDMILVNTFCYILYLSSLFNKPNIDKVKFEKYKSEIFDCYKNHQAEQNLGFKSATITITENGFLRYTLKYATGKTEYYSLKLEKLNGISFLGSENAVWMKLNCEDNFVIYQTYNDKNGNLDEMINSLKIPLKNLNIEEINQLNMNFQQLKSMFYKNTDN